jgi:hypothetical protein
MRLAVSAATLRGVTWFAPSWIVLPSAASPELVADSYLTDGERLFRVVSPPDPGDAEGYASLEDCLTLEVAAFSSDELFEMDLWLVRAGSTDAAA